MAGLVERPVLFNCGGDRLLGIVAEPEDPERVASLGVVVIVGGPQYRVGSHRQFLSLTRRAAGAGFASFRFDYRGMGDSEGAPRSFEEIDDDIRAAVDAFMEACPRLRGVTLWGLCDGASAALLYCMRRRDDRVTALCLLNPWVRSDETLARARVRHYYPGRLLEADFWSRMIQGQVSIVGSFAEWVRNLRLARRTGASGSPPGFRTLMAEGLRGFQGAILLVLSGKDATAQEFLECVRSDAEWGGVLESPHVTRLDLADADHTFSDALAAGAVDGATIEWLRTLQPKRRP